MIAHLSRAKVFPCSWKHIKRATPQFHAVLRLRQVYLHGGGAYHGRYCKIGNPCNYEASRKEETRFSKKLFEKRVLFNQQ